MNIAYFLLPKNSVAYLYDDYTFRQGLEKMRYHGYTAIPVITRSGTYVGTLRGNHYPPVRITVSMEELMQSAMNQNFIPVVDDLGKFTGIVTRKDIIRYYAGKQQSLVQPSLRKIV